MPAIHRLADLEEHLLQGMGLGDGVPAIEGRADDDCFEAERNMRRLAFPSPRVWLSRTRRITHPEIRHNSHPVIPQLHAASEVLAQRAYFLCRRLYVCDAFRPDSHTKGRWSPRSDKSTLRTHSREVPFSAHRWCLYNPSRTSP